ncbi:MAG: hydantoinase B/oxoprolinase family protein [Thermodesulfovibrionales bacterium]|nr:hydantoinase B/oxoprolinase family protein [Thermodesulfovibrionales bacterium]
MKKWRFAVDRGGTFTDIIGLSPEGELQYLKLLSNSPEYRDASIEGIRKILGISDGSPLPQDMIEGVRFGTTIATNALLERKGNKVLLIITKGLSGIIDIGYQNRTDLFKLCVKKPPPLYSALLEVDERIDSKGQILRDLDRGDLEQKLTNLNRSRIDSVAVVLMHSWINPIHELICEEVLLKEGFTNIFLSHRTMNSIKIVSRGQSTIVDAYLSIIIRNYIEEIKSQIGDIPFEFIESSGNLSHPQSFKGKNALYSGPAGGVIATAQIADELNLKGVIGFDMGGTSTDVSRFEGTFEKIYEKMIEGIPIQTEMLNIITVAAGGGSIVGFDGQKLTVGPQSAGSLPGPACYGFGGPLTITDANLLTGRLIPEFFPQTFGENRKSSINIEIVQKKFDEFTKRVNDALSSTYTPYELAEGLIRIANEKMAMAIKEISVSKGFDVRDYGLMCFGGASGQHVCAIASLLDIKTIIVHPLCSVMSAYGIGLANRSYRLTKTVLSIYNRDVHNRVNKIFESEDLLFRQKSDKPYLVKKEIDLRPKGAEASITIPFKDFEENLTTFKSQYKRLFGFYQEDREIELVNIYMEFQEDSEFFPRQIFRKKRNTTIFQLQPILHKEVFYDKSFLKVPVYLVSTIATNSKISGPALIIDSFLTVFIEPDFNASLDEKGLIFIEKTIYKKRDMKRFTKRQPDPSLLEIFNNLFMHAAEEMGIVLQKSAHSVNIKERLDFSCAIFDNKGDLVANAPHIPVHLGSMSDVVKVIYSENRNTMKPGDIYLSNNPYKGGSHLPDLTIIYPVFINSNKPSFFTVSRGHHSDIGGSIPGSMPSAVNHIDEEGLLIDNLLIVREEHFREKELIEIMSSYKYPVRNIDERISDLKAQIAAAKKGEREILNIVKRYGYQTVLRYMRYIQNNAEYLIKKSLQRLLGKENHFYSTFTDYLDDGTPIKAKIEILSGKNPPETIKAIIDFTGTGLQHMNDNLNAPLSVVKSAVMYVLRSLIDVEIPLNSGFLKPITIKVPKGTILNPIYPAPVASGNVETSQRIVDVLLGCLEITGASQGTMNNLSFQVEGEFPYYETIAGGSGALEGCEGASGVHVHMTNTKLTDPEILEHRHPGILLERFLLRKNSGGLGKFKGGDGVIREIKFLKPAVVSILSERRVYQPYGVRGGQSGKSGLNIHKKANGEVKILKNRESIKVEAGDSIIIETPGGGGYGQINSPFLA